MKHLRALPRPAFTLLAVVLLLAFGIGVTTALRPASVAQQPPANGTLPVSSASLVCLDPSTLGPDSITEVTAGASSAPGAAGPLAVPGADPGELGLGALDPTASPATTVDSRGPTAHLQVARSGAAPVVVRALGGVSPGVSAIQVTVAPDGQARGLAATRCVTPGTDSWFVGLGTEVGHSSRLHLVNAEQAPASVQIGLSGPDGVISIGGLGSVVVPARASATYDLDALAPDQTSLAVHVVARTGRVAAGILDQRVVDLDSQGVDWVPAAAPPARVVVVPGVSRGSGARILQLIAPGDLDTRVEVRLLTESGAITPVGLEAIQLTAGEVTQVAIDPVAAGDAVAIELRSDEPIVAGLRVVTGATDQPHDLAYTAGALPLADPTYVSGARGGPGWTSRLILTASAGATTTTLTYVAADTGAVIGSTDLTLDAGSTTIAPDLADAPTMYGILVSPHGPGVMAVLQLGLLQGGVQFASLVPLVSEALVVDVPRVRQDLSTGLRPR